MNNVRINPAAVLLQLLGVAGKRCGQGQPGPSVGKEKKPFPTQFVLEMILTQGRTPVERGKSELVPDDTSTGDATRRDAGGENPDDRGLHLGCVGVPVAGGLSLLQERAGATVVPRQATAPETTVIDLEGKPGKILSQIEVPVMPARGTESRQDTAHQPAGEAANGNPLVEQPPVKEVDEPTEAIRTNRPSRPTRTTTLTTPNTTTRLSGTSPRNTVRHAEVDPGAVGLVRQNEPPRGGTSGGEEHAARGSEPVPAVGHGVQTPAGPENAASVAQVQAPRVVASVEELFTRLVEYSRVENGAEATTWQLRIVEPDMGRIEVRLDWRDETLHAVFRGQPQLGLDFEQQVLSPLRALLQQEGIALGTFAWEGGQQTDPRGQGHERGRSPETPVQLEGESCK